MHVGIAGEVRCVITKADGKVKIDTGFQKNLILNQGLDFFGGGNGGSINASCAVGAGNSLPTVTQTKLDTFIAITSGTDVTSDYSYVDKGDDLYRMWEQKKYRFTGLDDVNISEVGLVSTGSTSANYYLTTRALIKDGSGAPTSISVKTGETLDIYYKVHKVVDTRDKSFVIDVLDGSGGAVPYNVVLRPMAVGIAAFNSVAEIAEIYFGYTRESYYSTGEIGVITGQPIGVSSLQNSMSPYAYVSGSYKRKVLINYGLNSANVAIRSLASGHSVRILPFQMRLGRVSDDAPLTKTANDTLAIPFEISWGRFEGEL